MSTGLLLANLAGAIVAALANLWGLVAGPREQRPLRATVAALAATYVALDTTAITGLIGGDTRTAIAQGLGPVVWLTVWAWPPIRTATSYRHTIHALTRLLGQVSTDQDREAIGA